MEGLAGKSTYHANLMFNAQNPCKLLDVVEHVCNPSTPTELTKAHSLECALLQKQEIPCLNKMKDKNRFLKTVL